MNEALIHLAAMASTLDETKGCPESALWLPFMGKMPLADFQRLVSVLVTLGICTVSDHYITFTEPAVGTNGAKFLAGVREVWAKHATA